MDINEVILISVHNGRKEVGLPCSSKDYGCQTICRYTGVWRREAVAMCLCYDSLPPYRARSRDWKRTFCINSFGS